MTEKIFKYMMKQSLPLFVIILIFGSFFVTGFINQDNLSVYVFLLSVGIPFLFQFSRFNKKTAYFYGSLPIKQEKLWIARMGCVQFLVLVPSLLFLFALICRQSISFFSMLQIILAWMTSLFLVTSLNLLILSFGHTLFDAVIIFVGCSALPTFLMNTFLYLTTLNMKFGYTAPGWFRYASPWQRLFEILRESLGQLGYGWNSQHLGNWQEFGIALLLGSFAAFCFLFRTKRFRSEDAGRMSNSKRILLCLTGVDTALLLLVITWQPISEITSGLFFVILILFLLYFGGLILAKQAFKITVKEVGCLLVLILAAQGINMAYRKLCYMNERLRIQRMSEVTLEFYVYPNKGRMIPENLSCHVELPNVKDPLVLNELRGWMKMRLDGYANDRNYYEYDDWNDEASRAMQIHVHNDQNLKFYKNIPMDLMTNSQVMRLFFQQELPENCQKWN